MLQCTSVKHITHGGGINRGVINYHVRVDNVARHSETAMGCEQLTLVGVCHEVKLPGSLEYHMYVD